MKKSNVKAGGSTNLNKSKKGLPSPTDSNRLTVYKCPVTYWPSKFRTTLKYYFTGALTSTTGSIATNAFRLNSVYDPDFTGTGVSAFGLSALSGLYGQYLVHSARIRISFVSGAAGLMDVAYVISDATPSTPANLELLGMRRNARKDIVAPSSGMGVLRWQDLCDVAKFKGHPIEQYEDLAASTSADPVEILWLSVYAQSSDHASTGSVYAQVYIDYDVEFRLPISPLT